ncbi:hypothetical protein [Streptomyces sp. UNOB3_S3]|uniref:hypothetical protein n=1 Tax=Streptomyces sp. UNOB3_S3 TaxID=2871682 RepID=UPI001E2E2DA4|nr:hypothetical protein [Streptomyces sp. UNOB3_S3]MCC3776924.1 hypothetical protein [Streptomyces sp. UNOB3_S3]
MHERESTIIESGRRWMDGKVTTDAYISTVLKSAATSPAQELMSWLRSRLALVMDTLHR